MAIQIGDEPERISLAEKLAPWLRRFIIGGALVWICFSLENYYEDTRSHTIKVSYPLLMSYEKITNPGANYDPAKAIWKPVETGFPVADGTILYVKVVDAIYVVKIWHQTIQPEQADYLFVKTGTNDPFTRGIAETLPDGISLPGAKIGWSGKSEGHGFLYLDDAFIWNKPPRYTIGVPFQSGDLNNFRTVPANVHFESVPWKIRDATADADEIIPLR